MPSKRPQHLEPSQLGTKEYWDKTYDLDLINHSSNPSDVGTVWFSDSAAEEKILDYLISDTIDLNLHELSILDLGTGNGSMLFLLREEGGFQGRMVGVDYSRSSVNLASNIAEGKNMENEVDFKVWDIMRDNTPTEWGQGFDVVLDKGTFDAISLSGETDMNGKRLYEGYRDRVEKLVRPGGLLLVTSCNWTEEELKEWFLGAGLDLHGRVNYPSFRFGGQTGQSISTVCLKKRT